MPRCCLHFQQAMTLLQLGLAETCPLVKEQVTIYHALLV
jgi:hypothetical protein